MDMTQATNANIKHVGLVSNIVKHVLLKYYSKKIMIE